MIDLITHLQAAYNQALRAAKHPDIDELLVAAEDFGEFARDYLRKNPPQQIIYPHGGVGVTLANHEQVLIAPADNVANSVRGTMQPSGAIPITGAETIKDMQSYDPNAPMQQLGGMQDMSKSSGPIDYKLPQPKQS